MRIPFSSINVIIVVFIKLKLLVGLGTRFFSRYNPIEKLWKNTEKDSAHLKHFKTFEDLHASVIKTFETYMQDAGKILCVMRKMCGDFAITV